MEDNPADRWLNLIELCVMDWDSKYDLALCLCFNGFTFSTTDDDLERDKRHINGSSISEG